MNIGLITEKYSPDSGGLAVSAARLARLLASHGHAVRVVSPTSGLDPGQSKSIQTDGVSAYRFGAQRRTDDTLADWFSALLAKHQQAPFDLLHAYFITQAGFVATYAAHYLDLPSVVSARGNDLDRAVFDPGKAAHVLYALQNASAVTANSRDLQHKAGALAPGRQVILTPNGVDTDLFQPLPRDEGLSRALGLESGPVIGFVGEARLKKGLAPLLLAFSRVAREHKASLLLVGGAREDGDKELLKVFQKQNPDLRVVITPFVAQEHLPAYYSLLDVLVMPSLRDGLPNALLEGMACGRAAVATNVGGMPDAIQDGHNGLLVPPGDAQELVFAIEELLEDPSLRQRLGQNARQTILDHFTLEGELRANLEIYAGLLAKSS